MSSDRDHENEALLVFDYDGTLHETMEIYRPAVCETIRWLLAETGAGSVATSDAGSAPIEIEAKAGTGMTLVSQDLSRCKALLEEKLRDGFPGEERFRKWIGMTAEEMWQDFLPGMPDALRQQAIRRVGRNMEEALLRPDKGRWYPGISRGLDRLREAGYIMLVLSNCTEAYARAHWAKFHMSQWFSAFLASESYQNLPKAEILRKLLDSPGEILGKAAVLRGRGEDAAEDTLAEETPGARVAGSAAEDVPLEETAAVRISEAAGVRITKNAEAPVTASAEVCTAETANVPTAETAGEENPTGLGAVVAAVAAAAEVGTIVLGDRAPDRDAALANGLPFLACIYGYGTAGELSGASSVLQAPDQLPQAVAAANAYFQVLYSSSLCSTLNSYAEL